MEGVEEPTIQRLSNWAGDRLVYSERIGSGPMRFYLLEGLAGPPKLLAEASPPFQIRSFDVAPNLTAILLRRGKDSQYWRWPLVLVLLLPEGELTGGAVVLTDAYDAAWVSWRGHDCLVVARPGEASEAYPLSLLCRSDKFEQALPGMTRWVVVEDFASEDFARFLAARSGPDGNRCLVEYRDLKNPSWVDAAVGVAEYSLTEDGFQLNWHRVLPQVRSVRGLRTFLDGWLVHGVRRGGADIFVVIDENGEIREEFAEQAELLWRASEFGR